MFSGGKSNSEEPMRSSNIIGNDTTIEGNIITIGNVRIEGKFIGNLSTKAKAILGEKSIFEGKLTATNAEVAGKLEGTIEISELLILKPSAIIKGDIFTKKLVFEKEATFNGRCIMQQQGTVQNKNILRKDYEKKFKKEKATVETT